MNTHARWIHAAALATMFASGARADNLRNVKPGQMIPSFSLATLSGGRIGSDDLEGKVVILVFLSAEQHSSEQAALSAQTVFRELRRDDLALVYVTADVARAPYFRQLRDRTGQHGPLGLDFGRELYGALGLIVLPTTVVIDRQGRLAHVISVYKSDYEHVLRAYARHALGLIDDDRLRRDLETPTVARDRLRDRIALHRAAAGVLRKSGLPADAENELRTALAIDPDDAATRLDLASLLIETGRVKDAAVIVSAVLQQNPDHRRGTLLHGVVLYYDGDLARAEEVLTQALVLNPDPVYTHYYLGLIYEKTGDSTRALEHYREALSRLLEDRPM